MAEKLLQPDFKLPLGYITVWGTIVAFAEIHGERCYGIVDAAGRTMLVNAAAVEANVEGEIPA